MWTSAKENTEILTLLSEHDTCFHKKQFSRTGKHTRLIYLQNVSWKINLIMKALLILLTITIKKIANTTDEARADLTMLGLW